MITCVAVRRTCSGLSVNGSRQGWFGASVKTVGKYDFVFCGRQAIDGDTAQVGPQTAEKLDIPQVTYLEEFVDGGDDTAKIKRNIGHGWEVVEVSLPVLVTVTESAADAGGVQPFIDWSWLEEQPVHRRMDAVMHLRFASPIEVFLDGRRGSGVVLKPKGS